LAAGTLSLVGKNKVLGAGRMNNNNFMPFPKLTTERLILRKIKLEDEKELFNLRTNKDVSEFIGRPLVKTNEEARQFISKINNGIRNNEWIFWAITMKDQNKLVGTICLWNFSKDRSRAEIGYELMPVYQGRGIMQEALKAVIEYGLKNMKLNSIEAFTSRRNAKSIRLLERSDFIDETFNRGNSSSEDEKVYELICK
jgi:[ribosomal protein S5]-alanine N-acetyltransferase